MNRPHLLIRALGIALALGLWSFTADSPATAQKAPRKTSQAWTLDEARRQLVLNPGDPYLQYVALQLAEGEKESKDIAKLISGFTNPSGRDPGRRVDLFALFTGAAAVQESLQLDTMQAADDESVGRMGDQSKETVEVSGLVGPQVESHPWGKMLAAQSVAGIVPQVSPLAMCVPEDQYFVAFDSVEKLLEASELSDLWGAHLFSQAASSAKTHNTSARLKEQLAVETDPLTRPFYDMVVQQVALTGSDLYFRTGSDTTLLFKIRQPEVFRLRMDGFLAAAEKSRPDAVRSTGKILGVDYVEVSTDDRAVHVFSAYPRADLHVRSNSRVALTRVLETIAGRSADGNKVKPLGNCTEFKYIRTLMTRGAEEEHGFVYLSDPFIRRVVGPELKLTERRRLLCYNHLRMIGHAAMLHQTQYGRPAESLDQLADRGCAPGVFGRGKLRCPCGGNYSLSSDGTGGVCSHHGRAGSLVPCCEIPLARVTKAEAEQYKEFVEEYSRYWRTFFDPIAIRIQLTPKQYRAETIILPLIDNSVYSGMAMSLGGEPEPLDGLPVPERNIFSSVVNLNKEALLGKGGRGLPLGDLFLFDGRGGSKDNQPDPELVKAFLTQGIGRQIGLHVYDASPTFDFNLTGFLGDLLGRFRNRGNFINDEVLYISFLISSLNAPVYVAIPVEDAQIVDRFLEQTDLMLAELARRPSSGGWFNLEFDFYRVPLEDNSQQIRCYNVQFGPIKWRMFFGRIGDGLYLASKRFILDDLAALERSRAESPDEAAGADQGPSAHAMIRVRPQNWDQVLPSFQLGWAESSRKSCLNNLGPLSSVARSLSASAGEAPSADEVHREADSLHAVHFFCPDGGRYQLSADRREITCSTHGTAAQPRQMTAPAADSPMGRVMKDFAGVTAALTFLEDGLHAVVTVQRK